MYTTTQQVSLDPSETQRQQKTDWLLNNCLKVENCPGNTSKINTILNQLFQLKKNKNHTHQNIHILLREMKLGRTNSMLEKSFLNLPLEDMLQNQDHFLERCHFPQAVMRSSYKNSSLVGEDDTEMGQRLRSVQTSQSNI